MSQSPDEAHRRLAAAVATAAAFLGSEQPFRARAKGTGVVVTRPGGLRAHEYVCDYLGDVYPPFRWLEKLACVHQARRDALGRPVADAAPPGVRGSFRGFRDVATTPAMCAAVRNSET